MTLILVVETLSSLFSSNTNLPSLTWFRFYELATNPETKYRPQGSHYYPQHSDLFNSIYNYHSSFDRAVPNPNIDASVEYIFMGCSFTFGIGVNDDQTFPAFFVKRNKNARAINLGLPGFGPNESLAFLRRYKKKSDDPQISTRIGIYTLFNDHINRSALNLSHLWWSDPRDIIFFDTKSNAVKGGGVLAKENYSLYLWSLFLKTSHLAKLLYSIANHNIDNPSGTKKLSQQDILHTSRVLKQLEKEFLQHYPDSKFYIFLMKPTSQQVAEILKKEGFKILNPHNHFGSQEILPDGHFNPKGNQQMAEALDESLKAVSQ